MSRGPSREVKKTGVLWCGNQMPHSGVPGLENFFQQHGLSPLELTNISK